MKWISLPAAPSPTPPSAFPPAARNSSPSFAPPPDTSPAPAHLSSPATDAPCPILATATPTVPALLCLLLCLLLLLLLLLLLSILKPSCHQLCAAAVSLGNSPETAMRKLSFTDERYSYFLATSSRPAVLQVPTAMMMSQ